VKQPALLIAKHVPHQVHAQCVKVTTLIYRMEAVSPAQIKHTTTQVV